MISNSLNCIIQYNRFNKLKTENLNKHLNSATWNVSFKEFRSIRNKNKYQDIFNFKVTHSESRLAKSISKIMDLLDKNGKLNTSQIKRESKLSWDSVIKSLKILYKKKTVKIITIRDRKNNEKIYSLDRNRAICYHEHIFQWKNKNYYQYLNKKMTYPLERDIKIEKQLPEKWWQTEITFSKEDQKQFHVKENKIMLEMLPVVIARGIRDEYVEGDLCFDCFENGNISRVKIIYEGDGEMAVCPKCGSEKERVERSILNNKIIKARESRRKYETKILEKKVLKRKNPL